MRRGAVPFPSVAVSSERARAAGWARERCRAGRLALCRREEERTRAARSGRRSGSRDGRPRARDGARCGRQQAAPPLCERLASPCHQGRGRAIAAPRRASLLRLTAVRNAPAQARSLCFAADGTAAVPLRPRSSERRLAPLQSQERPLAGTRRRSSMASGVRGLGRAACTAVRRLGGLGKGEIAAQVRKERTERVAGLAGPHQIGETMQDNRCQLNGDENQGKSLPLSDFYSNYNYILYISIIPPHHKNHRTSVRVIQTFTIVNIRCTN